MKSAQIGAAPRPPVRFATLQCGQPDRLAALRGNIAALLEELESAVAAAVEQGLKSGEDRGSPD